MSSIRQPSEWGIGKVKTLFSYLEFKVGNVMINFGLMLFHLEKSKDFKHAIGNDVSSCLPFSEHSHNHLR